MREKKFKLRRKERDELERRYKQERDKRVAQRIHCIILLHDGKNAKQVAKILMVSKKLKFSSNTAWKDYAPSTTTIVGWDVS